LEVRKGKGQIRINKMNCELMLTYDTPANRKFECDGSKNDMGYLYEACDQISHFCHQ